MVYYVMQELKKNKLLALRKDGNFKDF